MYAAVLHQFGQPPVYQQIADPQPTDASEVVMEVKAASIKNLDKLRASGTHYASYAQLPAVVGIDAVGVLPDGRLVYAYSQTGTIAEKTIVKAQQAIPVPANLDLAIAAALPNAVLGAALALKSRGKMQPGATVLINGATGITGRIAVQAARIYGASQIIATGRNDEMLQQLLRLGATSVVSLKATEQEITDQLKAMHQATPIDLVIDYLWGRPVELILAALKGGNIGRFTHPVRLVTVGSMAGEQIALSSATLRSADIEIVGSGIGSLPPQAMQQFATEVMPEMFRLAAEGQLIMDTETAPLSDIAAAWNREPAPGKRMVILCP